MREVLALVVDARELFRPRAGVFVVVRRVRGGEGNIHAIRLVVRGLAGSIERIGSEPVLVPAGVGADGSRAELARGFL